MKETENSDLLKLRVIVCSCFVWVLLLAGCDLGTYSGRVEANGGKLPSTSSVQADDSEQSKPKANQGRESTNRRDQEKAQRDQRTEQTQRDDRELDESAARGQAER